MPSSRLPPLPDFLQLSERVWRVMGLNPGRFTLQGTNTYLVGHGPRKILFDCGEGHPDYVPLLEASLHQISPEAYISDIVITHCHVDHFGGLKSIMNSSLNHGGQIKVHKYILPVEDMDEQDIVFQSHMHIDHLNDEDFLHVDDHTTIQTIYTPGHSKDHCSFYLVEENAILTGDCVLGHGTVVFDDLADYMSTLHKLNAFKPGRLYPGHGPVVENGSERILQYLQSRQQREDQIVQLMTQRSWTAVDLAERIYTDVPYALQAAVVRGVALHLLKLEKEGRARLSDGSTGYNSTNVFEMVHKEWSLFPQPRL
ncbi:beta-lactamase-like protein [Radiomyces spectabilis]|uniref:beta-lactamase-like protein n=1 Tax=Radiomyces spectabilis TaxID=64574 RepID=UPI00221EF9E3|nr:beta-lactamase-like protein [Radiomyces spectabilis]KAI8371475.1 beta-lactamase-like protein [Radiomyces spectabilis]